MLEPGANSPSIQGTVRGGRLARVVLRWIRSRTQLEEALDRMREELMPELVDLNERPLAAYDVGADGHFSFGGLPPGSYCVDVGAPGRTPRRRVVTVPAKDVDFDLAASAQLEVLVVDGAGVPYVDVKVHVQTKRDARAWSLRTNTDGVAVFASLPDAELSLVAARELRDSFSGGVHPFERNAFFPKDDLALVAGETRRVQPVLVEAVPVTLHVHDINERSIEGANIAISLQSPHVPGDLLRDDVRSLAGRVFETDVDGDLHLELVPSVWNFEVWADGRGFHQMFMLERARRGGSSWVGRLGDGRSADARGAPGRRRSREPSAPRGPSSAHGRLPSPLVPTPSGSTRFQKSLARGPRDDDGRTKWSRARSRRRSSSGRVSATLRGWFARVASRVVAHLRRDEIRRGARERIAARDERTESRDANPAAIAASRTDRTGRGSVRVARRTYRATSIAASTTSGPSRASPRTKGSPPTR